MTEDTKMMIGVGALVIAGAAGLALLGGLSAEREAARQDAGSIRQAVPQGADEAPRVEPAAYTGSALTEEASLPVESDPVLEADVCRVPEGSGRIAQGLIHWEAREYAEAATCFGEEAERGKRRPWVHYMLGLSRWKAGELKKAEEAMEESADLDGTSIKTFVNLARIRNDLGEYEGALEAAREALRIDPESPTALFLEGRTLRNLGARDEALKSLRRSVELDPSNGYAQNLLGLTLLESDGETEAVPVLEQAVKLEPEVAYIRNNLGMAQERCGNLYQAKLAYRRAADLDGGTGNAAMNLARLDPKGLFRPVDAPEAALDVPVAEAGFSSAATGGEEKTGDGDPSAK